LWWGLRWFLWLSDCPRVGRPLVVLRDVQAAGRLAAVEVVCLDPYEGYREAVRRLKAGGVLGEKTRVAADPSSLKRVEPVNSVCEDVASLLDK